MSRYATWEADAIRAIERIVATMAAADYGAEATARLEAYGRFGKNYSAWSMILN